MKKPLTTAAEIIAHRIMVSAHSGHSIATAGVLDDLAEAGYVIVRSEPTYEACVAAGFPWENPPFPPRYRALISKLTDPR